MTEQDLEKTLKAAIDSANRHAADAMRLEGEVARLKHEEALDAHIIEELRANVARLTIERNKFRDTLILANKTCERRGLERDNAIALAEGDRARFEQERKAFVEQAEALAAEAVRLREALRDFGLHMRHGEQCDAECHCGMDKFVAGVRAALSAPSSAEAALAERDAKVAEEAVERYRASLAVVTYSQEHFIKRMDEAKAEARAAALEEAAKLVEDVGFIDVVFDGEQDREVPFCDRIRALATAPSAASGKETT